MLSYLLNFIGYQLPWVGWGFMGASERLSSERSKELAHFLRRPGGGPNWSFWLKILGLAPKSAETNQQQRVKPWNTRSSLNGDRAIRRPHILCSICGHSLGALAKAVGWLFIASLPNFSNVLHWHFRQPSTGWLKFEWGTFRLPCLMVGREVRVGDEPIR